MAIKGSLSEATLADVIQLLSFSDKSGCLSVTDGKNFGNIFIKNGRIIYATLLNRKDRLGDLLLRKQKIDDSVLKQALEVQKKKKRRLGEILVEIDAITIESLEEELKEQIAETIFTMLTWDSGYFNFEADLLPGPEEFIVQLSPQEILLEGARRIDEWRKIENKLPPFETILVLKGDASGIPLTVQEQKTINLIDGARTIDEILKLSEYDFFETCRIIYGLLSAGLLEKPEKPIVVKKTISDIAEYKNLGFAFYKTEMFEEAEREYRKILEIEPNHAESMLYLGLIQLKRGNYEDAKANFLKAQEKQKSLSILNNIGYICIKLKQYDKAITYLNEAREISSEDPKVNSNLGVGFYLKGDFNRAGEIFSQVLEKFPELIIPYIYLPVIYFKNGDAPKSMALLKDAIDKFPRFGTFKNNLAVLYESIDRPEEAEKLYRQAMEENPQDISICRNLADFYYETQILGAAKELYERIPEDKRDWKVFFKLGNIYLRQGDVDSAHNFWEKARALNPEEEIIVKNIEILQKSRGA